MTRVGNLPYFGMFIHNSVIDGPRPKRLLISRHKPHFTFYCSSCGARQPTKLATLVSLWFLVTKCDLPRSGVLAAALTKQNNPAILYNYGNQSLPSSLQTTVTRRQVKLQTVSLRSLQQNAQSSQSVKTYATQHFGLRLVDKLRKLGLPDTLVLFIISSLPVLELRGAIPIGVWMLSLVQVYFLSVLGNLLPVPLLLQGLKHRKVRELFSPMLKRAERMKQQIANETFREIALALFVAIPLPGTGAWSGAIIAFVLNMPFWGATVSITSGVLVAGLIMLILTKMGKIGALIAVGVLLMSGVSALWKTYKRTTL